MPTATTRRCTQTLSLLAVGLAVSGCRTRTIEVTSEPPGALVWLNDEQVGRTPLEADFTHYGTYDVRLRLEGHVPVSTYRTASAPLADQPGIDFFTQAFPGRAVTSWHFVLQPLPELTDQRGSEEDVVQRARQFRAKAVPESGSPPAPAQPKGEAGTPTTVTPSGTSQSTTAPAPTTDR